MASYPIAGVPGLYLLHLERPLAHSQHYLGWARNRDERVAAHEAGQGSSFMRAVVAAGIRVSWVQFLDGDKHLERRYKRWKNLKALCELCKPERRARARESMRLTRRQLRLFVWAMEETK